MPSNSYCVIKFTCCFMPSAELILAIHAKATPKASLLPSESSQFYPDLNWTLTPPWERQRLPAHWTPYWRWRRFHPETGNKMITAIRNDESFYGLLSMWGGKKYLFNFFDTLLFLEWFEEVIHIGFFKTGLEREKKVGLISITGKNAFVSASVYQLL